MAKDLVSLYGTLNLVLCFLELILTGHMKGGKKREC